MLYSGSKQIFSHLHLPLALHQRGGQLLVFLQEGLPQLCSQDQVRVQPSAAVTGARGRRGRREREGQGHGWGQRKEGVLQAGGGETGCPRSEHLGRAQSANITAAAGGRWDEGLLDPNSSLCWVSDPEWMIYFPSSVLSMVHLCQRCHRSGVLFADAAEGETKTQLTASQHDNCRLQDSNNDTLFTSNIISRGPEGAPEFLLLLWPKHQPIIFATAPSLNS